MGKALEAIIPESMIKSMNWVRHIGFPPIICNHYREPLPGTGHAVCCRGICRIHYDKYSPLADPLRHLVHDTPLLKILTSSLALLLISSILS